MLRYRHDLSLRHPRRRAGARRCGCSRTNRTGTASSARRIRPRLTSRPGRRGGRHSGAASEASAPAARARARRRRSWSTSAARSGRSTARSCGTQADGGGQLHVEAHSGGEPASRRGVTDAKYTLISADPARCPAGRRRRRTACRARSSTSRATSVCRRSQGDGGEITSLVEDGATPPKWSAFDVTATFRRPVTGHVYAVLPVALGVTAPRSDSAAWGRAPL